MGRFQVIAVVLTLLVVPATVIGDSGSVDNDDPNNPDTGASFGACGLSAPQPGSLPSQIRLWEAWAKGYATIFQTDHGLYGGTYTINNNAPVDILIDEYILLMSPSPAYPWEDDPGVDDETQDGILTITETILSGDSFDYQYGDYVAAGYVGPPPWWCTEDSEFTNAGVEISLGGEILPYVMENLIVPYDTTTQDDVWYYLRHTPAVIVGKNPLWEEIDNTGDEVDITIGVTNIGFIAASDVVVTDTIPTDYSYDPSSFDPTPNTITNNPDGSITLEWNLGQIDAAVQTPSNQPTYYTTIYIEYTLITPSLSPDLRIFLPRAYVDRNNNTVLDAESAKPLLETILTNRPPVAVLNDLVTSEGLSTSLDGSSSYDPDESYGDYIAKYEWDFEDDGIFDYQETESSAPDGSFDGITTHTYGDNYAFKATLRVTDSFGASASTTAQITVNNVVPTLDYIPDVTVSEGATWVYQGHATDPGSDDLTFTWSWGDGTSDTTAIYYNDGSGPDPYPSPEINPMDVTNSQLHSYQDDGTYYVTLTVEDDDTGERVRAFFVTVLDLGPTAEFIWTPRPQFEGSPVQFTDLSTSYPDLIVSWQWDFEGFGSSSLQHPEFTFMDDGTYSVTLTITDDDGTSSSISHDVTIRDLAPTAEFMWSPDPQDEGSPVQFTDLSTVYPGYIVSWDWDFAGLGSSSLQHPEFTFMDNANYLVTLTVTDDDGTTHSVSHTVVIQDLGPSADFSWSPPTPDEGSSVQFTDLSTSYPDVIVSWQWDFGGLGTSNLQHPDFTFMDDGTYSVTLTVTDDDGTTHSVSYDVVIQDLAPTGEFSWSPPMQDEGSPVSFNDLSTSYPDVIVAWFWDFAGLGISTLQHPTFTFMDDDTYTVTLTVTDDDGTTHSVPHDITILDLAPLANFSWSPDPQDEGSSVSFTDLSTSYPDVIVGWEWDFGDGGTSTLQNPSHIYGDNDDYTVTLIVTDDDGTTDEISYEITINNVAPNVLAGEDEEVDEGAMISFAGAFSDPGWLDTHIIEWDFGDGNFASGTLFPTNTYGDDGSYEVTLTVTDDDGGVGTETLTVTVNNVAPTIEPLETYEVNENSPVTLSATAEDPGSDDLTFTWDWDDGTSDTVTIYYNDGTNPDPEQSPGGTFPFSIIDTVSHTYGDDGDYQVTLTVEDDDEGIIIASTTVTVHNVAPAIDPLETYETNENQEVTLSATASDPGSDDLTFTWNWGDGTSDTVTIYYNDGTGPDPDPSPEINPIEITDTVSHTYGDDDVFTVTLTVSDDDDGVTVITSTVTVHNVAPTIETLNPDVCDENSLVSLSGTATDPGSDDLTFTWDWGDGTSDTVTIFYNDGIGPDPDPSPEINPMDITDSVSHVYGDNGEFTVTLTVSDDDDGLDILTTTVTVHNVAPSIYVDRGIKEVDENSPITLSGHVTDPGSDDLTFTWNWGDGTPDTVMVYYNNGVSPDPYPSPEINPMDMVESASHVYGDNGQFDVILTVEDDDEGVAEITINVIVNNVAPTAEIEMFMYVNLTLRIAGEKYHSVGIHLMEDGEEVTSAVVTRRPGNPDEQTGTLAGCRIDLTRRYTVLIDYLPNDPRVNGNVWGANPVWVDITYEDGSVTRLHHTFNVRQSDWDSDHWNHIDPWEVALSPHLAGHTLHFQAMATDPGSDDLTFFWEFGDGTTDGPTTYYNDGANPDPLPSPEINPMTAVDSCVHKYGIGGTFTLTLTVTDDDGGICVMTYTINQ